MEWVKHLLQHVSGVYPADYKFLLWRKNYHTRMYDCRKAVRVNVELRNSARLRYSSQPSRQPRPLLAWEGEWRPSAADARHAAREADALIRT